MISSILKDQGTWIKLRFSFSLGSHLGQEQGRQRTHPPAMHGESRAPRCGYQVGVFDICAHAGAQGSQQ